MLFSPLGLMNRHCYPILFLCLAMVLTAHAQPPGREQAGRTREDTLAAQLRQTTADRWYKNCFIYNLDVHTFQDSDGDGIGDFRGLTARLPYLKGLGVDVIWLAPFQPSPHRDDGYDVTDYYGIDSTCGTPGDFAEFLYRAHALGLRVMMDVSLAHTSDQHPWFKAACRDTTSPYHKWYWWSAQRPSAQYKGMAFPGVQKETWTWQPQAHAWYFHRFYVFQPHLNFLDPDMLAEGQRILGYWLDQGVDGFRIDAVPFVIEIPHPFNEQSDQSLTLITALRQFVQWRKGDAVLLGEANIPPQQISDYFGDAGHRLHMLFNFYGNQYLFYALAAHEGTQLRKALADTRNIPPVAQWVWFLRNHDEVDLGRLTDEQRQLVFRQFGPDSNMQLYGRGIRRRLAPMLHDEKLLRLAYSLLFALPGSPALHYGEELGMGDDLALSERLAVRTPMQWTPGKNAGFTDAGHPIRPLITGEYGYDRLNVQSEEHDHNSLLEDIRRLAWMRKECPEIGLGRWSIPDTSNAQVLALQYDYEGRRLLIVHNFSAGVQEVSVPVDTRPGSTVIDLIGGEEQKIRQPRISITLPGYGYKWLRFSHQTIGRSKTS